MSDQTLRESHYRSFVTMGEASSGRHYPGASRALAREEHILGRPWHSKICREHLFRAGKQYPLALTLCTFDWSLEPHMPGGTSKLDHVFRDSESWRKPEQEGFLQVSQLHAGCMPASTCEARSPGRSSQMGFYHWHTATIPSDYEA